MAFGRPLSPFNTDPFGIQDAANVNLAKRLEGIELHRKIRGAAPGATGSVGPGRAQRLKELEEQRKAVLQRFGELGSFFDTDPVAQQLGGFFQQSPFQTLLGQAQSTAAGSDVPFTPQITAAFLGREEDQAAGQVANASDLIRQSFSRRGMGGSGMELSALLNARRQSGQGLRAAIRDITSTNALRNFQARQAAQSRVAGLLGQQFTGMQGLASQRFGAKQAAVRGETDFRSKMRSIEDA